MSPKAVPIEIFLNSFRMICNKTTTSSNQSKVRNSFLKRLISKDNNKLKQKVETFLWGIIDTRKLQSPPLITKETAARIPPKIPPPLKLTKSFKKQFSSAQKRVNPGNIQNKSENIGSLAKIRVFVWKALIAGGLVYASVAAGIWGSTQDTQSLVKQCKAVMGIGDPEGGDVIVEKLQLDLKEKCNDIIKLLIFHIQNVPVSFLQTYDSTEKFIKALVESRK